jgi:RNA polymerase sigma factor for flagellar operon FliA
MVFAVAEDKKATTFVKPSSVRAMPAARAAYNSPANEEAKRTRLVEQYLPLVKSIVGKMVPVLPRQAEVEDIYSVAVKGLIVAISQYDPNKGSSLGAYASFRIRGAILDELRRLDYLPRGDRAKAKKLSQTISALEAKLGRPCTEDEVRDSLGLSLGEYHSLLKDTQPVYMVSVDNSSENSGDDGSADNLSEVLTDPNQQDIRDICERKDDILILRDRIKQLPEQQKKILVMYYYEEMKLSEIAVVFGLTEARISQILSHTILSLKSFFTKN